MKKMFYKISSLILVFVMFVSVASGCSKKVEEETQQNEPVQTENFIIDQNNSDYVIVTSENPTAFEEYAASELSNYLYSSTDVKLKIVKDTETASDDKIISIGYNKIQEGKVAIEKDKVGDDGFVIKTIEDDLFLLGGASTGTLYSVYEVLEYLIDFKVFATDEIHFAKCNQVNFYEFDLTQKPSIGTRYKNSAYFSSPGDVFDSAKLRLCCFDYSGGKSAMQMTDDGTVKSLWGCWAHTIGSKLIPWNKYYEDHPEWFEGVEHNDNYQVMLSNPDVINEAAKNLKVIMDVEKDSKFFMVGINDNSKTHSGDQKVAEENGGYSGVYMLFLNALDDIISQMYKEEGVEREYCIVGLAYAKYVDAPVDENLNPVNSNVIANENVAIMYAPIGADWSKALTDPTSETNARFEKAMRAWANVSSKMMVWSYSISFAEYLIDFDNYHTLKENYQFYEEIGVTFMYDQACGQTFIPFNALRDYVQSSLMWDTSLNTNELIEEFIDNYYKVAAPHIKDLFYCIRSNYKMFMDKGMIDILHCGNSEPNSDMYMACWTLEFCNDAMEYIDKAYEAVEKSSLSQEIKDKLVKRIKLDSIMPRYIMLAKFASSMNSQEYKELLDQFAIDVEMLEVTNNHETYGGRSIDDFIQSCRGKIQ